MNIVIRAEYRGLKPKPFNWKGKDYLISNRIYPNNKYHLISWIDVDSNHLLFGIKREWSLCGLCDNAPDVTINKMPPLEKICKLCLKKATI